MRPSALVPTLILLALAGAPGCKKTPDVPAAAAVEAPDKGDLSERIGVDPTIRTGKLDNGLTYYIEKNQKPANKAVLRLAVDAGSLLEEDDQLGIAHFLEHMAFNGTKSFPSNDLVDYLESVGTSFGPHLNAHTSFDETVYKLSVPTDDAEVFDKAFTVLKEWACCLALDPEEIEKERGVVLEEWRLREGLSDRMTKVRMPLTFAGSRYPDRMPIGTDESLKSFDPAVVGRFYADWYRPDLMAVIVVGDFDVDAVEAKIQERFGDLAGPETPRERVRYDVPPQEGPLYRVYADPELTGSFAMVMSKYDAPQETTWGEWLEREYAALATHVLSERFAELARQPDSPMLGASAGPSRLTPTEAMDALQVGAKEGRELEALELALLEVKRLREHGVTEPELSRARAARIEFMDKYEREAADTPSVVHADEIVRHFLESEPMPGTVPEAELTRRASRLATLADVNAWATGFLQRGDRVSMLFLPEKEGLEVPADTALAEVEARVAAATVEPPVVEATLDSLAPTPEPGTITERDDRYADLGWKGFTLSNGVKVYARKSDLKKGEIVYSGWREGGIADVDDAVFLSAWGADRIRSQSGLGEHDRSAVTRFLQGKSASFDLTLADFETSVSGSASPRDLGVALQGIHLLQTAPRFDAEAMQVALESWREQLKNPEANPDEVYSNTWRKLFWPDDPRRQVIPPEALDAVELDVAKSVWMDAVGSPSEWTYAFAGDLPDDFETQVATWLGSLPARDAGLTKVDRGFHRKPGEFREVLEIGSADRARYRTEYWIELDPKVLTPDFEWRVSAAMSVLNVRLREVLREELGGVYGVGVSSSVWDYPYAGMMARVEFQCDPERLDELEGAMKKVIDEVVAKGVDAKYVDARRAKSQESYEEYVQHDGFWVGQFRTALERGWDPHFVKELPEVFASITAEDVQKHVRNVFTSKNRGTVVLLPKPDAATE